ncbi:hypothetical protein RND81_11G177400 [Saponaria officinalis]|uniref:RRM domain-containing protein n=1 Tax=Saponaria officinalis TaxID=3572 RepID=A0AAW1HQ33_SAPOF
MSGRDGRESRDRSRRDNHSSHHHQSRHSSSSSRFDEKPPPRMKNPPSRHLWVGNLGQHVPKTTVEDHFFRFGELESVSFPPGRSYAFVNFFREEDAVAAFKSLQGFSVAGMPLKIEFAKSDKSSAPRDDNYYQQQGELQPSSRRSAFSSRESTMRDASPDAYFPEYSRKDDNISEHPSEILWIGFPSFLKVEETILRKAFSPFGEIDKITVFPGRTYAFVQFMNIASAVRAKETLQGKLFGNPRVHICFARNDHASSGSGRRGMGHKVSSSPHHKSHGHPGSSDSYRPERNFENVTENPRMRAPRTSNMEYGVPDAMSLSRNEPSWSRTKNTYEERGFNEPGVGVGHGLPYGRSPGREGNALIHEFSPRKLTRKSTYPEDPWDLPEDPYVFHEAKKLKTGSFIHDKELPEYPLHIPEEGRQGLPRMVSDVPPSDESWHTLPYGRHPPEHPVIQNAQLNDRLENWKQSHDTSHPLPSPFPSNPADWRKNTFGLPRSGMKEVWKWEGTIAKGGTPVCRARCFPVGKTMDIVLPEFLDCTARTGLDMLAKHYYQATNSWVVFFVAATDADMAYYNEFMHYLGDKQRAAVAKLDERNTLFLVPPSDFSENVLKIPGKLSISGVVLSLEPSSPSAASLPLASFPNPGMTTNSFPSAANVTSSVPSFTPAYGHGSASISDQASYGNHPANIGQPPQMPPQSFPMYGDYHHSGNSSSLNEHNLSTPTYQYPTEDFRAVGNVANQPQNQSRVPSGYVAQTSQFPSDNNVTSLFSQLQQPVQAENTQAQDDSESDPQKRLQATLQLAAALLQQIQQGKGT